LNVHHSNWLFIAALLSFAVGLAHSVLGERFILMRLPEQATFKARTLRFAWHLTTIAWWGVGAMLVLASRGRHLAWPVFLAIAILSLWAAD
jgi:hypothetical protein